MRIDFLGLEAFYCIADRGNFHRAAAHLNLSQTALSHRMKKLEEDLGVKLLARTTRHVSLTPAGVELLPVARRIMDDVQASFEDLRKRGKKRQHKLSIGCLPTLATNFLPRILEEFKLVRPEVQLRIFDQSASEITDHVENGTAEFGISIISAARFDLDITPLAKESFVLACPSDHPIARKGTASWIDIEGIPLMRVGKQTGNRILIDEALGSRRENMQWRYEVQHITTVVSFVQQGLALAVLPEYVLAGTEIPGIAGVPLRNPTVARSIGMLTRKGVPLSPAAEDLRAIIMRQFKAQAANAAI
jgi:DNA-binding transcriptional LysR family regulator